MNQYKIHRVLGDLNIKNAAVYVAEAEFGFQHVKEKILALEGEANILEVGCGSGILLSMLSEEFSKHRFNGIEPFGDGFFKLKELNSVVRKLVINLTNESYEEHMPENKYDLIYCINVFEHVDDWRDFMKWAADNLNAGGVFLVLSPNYGFPYESHFRIPIIFNKNITYKLFENFIKKYEQERDFCGLWNSLNFVKKKDVHKFCIQNESLLGFDMHDEPGIIDDLVCRITEDDEFRKRQFFVGIIARLLKKCGVFNLVKIFSNRIPYMKLSFVKRLK